MAAAPRVSIVIPTYNRRERLLRVLGALNRQTVPPELFEAVIVDDGSSDDTPELLARTETRFRLRPLRQKNGGPALARNTGLDAAEGELLLFLDDDVEPTPDLVLEHVKSHDAEANVVVMGPLASLSHYAQPWVAWEQEKLENQYREMMRGDWEPTFRQFWTGNASVARAHVIAAGGFDRSFNRAEDVELGRRLHERGLRFRFNPKARGLHHAERSLKAWVQMHKSYGTLEVQIFGGFGREDLVSTLAGNWSRIHPATRWLVSQCLGRPERHRFASLALETWLKVGAATKRPLAASQVCGALANLTYWQASADALGESGVREVFQRGDDLRKHGGARVKDASAAEKGR